MIDKRKLGKRLFKNSKLKEFPLLNFYILVAVFFQIIGEGFKIFWLQALKPLPIILMIIYIHGKNSPRDHLMPRFVQIGLIFSLVGDLMLMSNEDTSFLVGTCFFFVAHIFYIIAYRIGDTIKELTGQFRLMRASAYLIILFLVGLNVYLLGDKYPNKILFTAYGLVLAVESIAALARYQKTNRSSFYFVLIGVGFFVISDNLLAFLKFNAIKTDFGRFIIMLTYYASQYFIMHGALHHSNLQFELESYENNSKRVY